MRKSSRSIEGEQDPWTPVRIGSLYCSPACCGRCTWHDHERAVRDADLLVKKLRGRGWRPVVWENLGWHFQVVSGPVQVYGDRQGSGGRLRYSCMISSDVGGTGGSVLWTNQNARSYSDPNEAVKAELLAALRATLGVVLAVRDAARAAGHETPVKALDEIMLRQSAKRLLSGKSSSRKGRVISSKESS